MLKVLFLTNIPSPYRVDFFNELGKQCELTVAFEGKTATDRNDKWKADIDKHFNAVFLKGWRVRSDAFLCLDILKLLRKKWDFIVICGYSTPTDMLAIEFLRWHRIAFFLEVDGGFIQKDDKLHYALKKHFISSASGWFSSGKITTQYLVHYGAVEDKCYVYPFTSLKEKDFIDSLTIRKSDKQVLQKKLGMQEEKIILSVGRFSYDSGYGKGYDTLMRVAENMKDESVGFYIIGDKPTEEFTHWKKEKQLDHVYFIDFKTKEELTEYYGAADLFILLTRGDVWGLVINEAMMYGLPIISTNACIAARKLVQNGKNGFVVPVDDAEITTERVKWILTDPEKNEKYGRNSLEIIRHYTIDNMDAEYRKILCGVRDVIRRCAKIRLEIEEEKMVLSVGQFIPRKGYDILMKAASRIKGNVGFYIVGGEPTKKYSELKDSLQLGNIHFVGFKTKAELVEYYRAADLFVHPTREDIWGLVINEALGNLLPTVTTNRCVAGMELIKNDKNGYIVSSDNVLELCEKINKTITDNCMEDICAYDMLLMEKFSTLKMANQHMKIFQELQTNYAKK